MQAQTSGKDAKVDDNMIKNIESRVQQLQQEYEKDMKDGKFEEALKVKE